MIWTRCKQYIRHHKLACIVFVVILVYQTARIAHLEAWMGHFELVYEPIIEVIIARYTGDSE